MVVKEPKKHKGILIKRLTCSGKAETSQRKQRSAKDDW
jgi:hypothetical protein